MTRLAPAEETQPVSHVQPIFIPFVCLPTFLLPCH